MRKRQIKLTRDELVNYRDEGYSAHEVAAAEGRHIDTVRRSCRSHNVRLRKPRSTEITDIRLEEFSYMSKYSKEAKNLALHLPWR